MDFVETSIVDSYCIQPKIMEDKRGCFVKTFHKDRFLKYGLETSFCESYYTVSKKGVLRGLHFQAPPDEHAKLVYCVEGRVLDALVDLRLSSQTYGKYFVVELDAKQARILYVPPGVAHGFYVLSERAIMLYDVSSVYSPDHDTGILWDSVNIPWPDGNPNISDRDSQLIHFDKFQSPFK